MKYCFHDFETGGLENASILTYYAAITDQNFNKIDEIEFFFKPKDGIYKVSMEALAINKIDLMAHNKIAREIADCSPVFRDFLLKNTNYKKEKLYSAGHNVYFDNKILKKHIFPEYSEFFFKHNLDTAGLAVLLKSMGRLPASLDISLTNLANYYGLDTVGAHNSKIDVLLTISVLKCIIADLNTGQKNPNLGL